ncbi:diacylglycerol kinase [Basilea psittacipulmonis]|uniref:Diacylglycerol kinase n=1 Tax=Basilea psittacipulmonis DSM 24701 TaxID=1072685 RepID=A0A077DBK1_9BURK|nr:diacylglycerol kinase [Basilea psittacipulmonis]AIL32049.1 hypothetical protein IX83_00740 [Basilea psittacipulmonis DSM 24701]
MPEKSDYASQMKGKSGVSRIFKAFFYSLSGFRFAWDEPAFRQIVLLNLVLLIATFCLSFSLPVVMMLVMGSFISLLAELVNSAIEAAVDNTSLEKRPFAKRAKDIGSALQFLSIVLLIVLWGLALYGRFGM